MIKSGFKVRMHSYEYFIRRKKFVCVVVVYPEWNSATIYKVKWNIEESERAVENIVKILETLEPKLKIEII